MSKTISIKEGGLGRQMTVDKLKANLSAGGTALLVFEDEMSLGTKNITENGNYPASADGLAGYSSVTVNVAGGGDVTGKASDGSGDDARAYVDPETGQIVEEKIPSSIKVITPPTNQYGIYQDGQTITKDGMVVKGYLASGGEWGTVPTANVTINPTTAVYDESSDLGVNGTATISDTTGLSADTIAALPVSWFSNLVGSEDNYETGPAPTISDAIANLTHTADVYVFAYKGPNDTVASFACSTESFSGTLYTHNPGDNTTYTTSFSSSSYTINGHTFYGAPLLPSSTWDFSPVTNSTSVTEISYVILYGTRTEAGGSGSAQEITASWPRTGDGQVLSDTFEIMVAPPIYGGGES